LPFSEAPLLEGFPGAAQRGRTISRFLMQHRIQMLFVEHGFVPPRVGPASMKSVSKYTKDWDAVGHTERADQGG
jgi:hypothetical protein